MHLTDVVLYTMIGAASGVVSLVGTLYVLFRVGFRVEILWAEREDAKKAIVRIAILETNVKSIQLFAWHRAEAEARVRKAVYERDPLDDSPRD